MTLPIAPLYLKSISVIPWSQTLERVRDVVCGEVAPNASVLDLMCGPGQLIGEIANRRPDLELCGLDISEDYSSYASQRTSTAKFISRDIIEYVGSETPPFSEFDIVTITAGLHHLEYDDQLLILQSLSNQMPIHGVVIIAEICIEGGGALNREYQAEVMRYHWAVLHYALEVTRDPILLTEAIDVFRADMTGEEYKLGCDNMKKVLLRFFVDVHCERVWPQADHDIMDENTGEFIFSCRGPRRQIDNS